MKTQRPALLLALTLVLALLAPLAVAADSSAELTLRADGRSAAGHGPLARAERLQPGIAPSTPSGLTLQAEGRHTLRLGAGLSLQGNALLAHERLQGRGGRDGSRVNELHAAWDLGAWQLAAGKKVLGWDVGYGYRPNDVVQQEVRRTQFGQTPEGRALLMAEHFGADTAWTLVAVQPGRWPDGIDRQRGAREAALAGRVYHRLGALDVHGFARHGRHTGASAGLALAWVATDALALHASARAFRRHDRWAPGADAATVARSNPWQQVMQGGGTQWLVGGQWTGGPGLSLMVEAWHDGSALSDDDWRRWGERNASLTTIAAQPAWRSAAAGNLAWQATPFDAQNLRRDNLFLRLAWQPGDWTLSIDALVTPADRGRIVSAALQARGERWRLEASLRVFGGPATAVLAQLPQRRSAVLAATLAF
jgi:hypothetical protein